MPFLMPQARDRMRTRRQLSIPELQQQAQELELQNREFGAREIEQDKPGVFSRIIDVLSRPNFAIAGFAEELLDGTPSVTQGVTRAMAEIFSGIGGIKGEKRAFGEVLENLGVGTKTLADAFPALEGTWVGNFGSRGAAGLAADIFTDPLTYMSFGTLSIGKKVFQIGGKPVVRHINAKGMEIAQRVEKEVIDALGGAARAERRMAKTVAGKADDFSRIRGLRKLDREIGRRTFDALRGTGDDVAEEFLQEGGARIFGKTFLPASRIRAFYEPVLNAAKSLPGGEAAAAGARAMGDGMRKTINGIFGAHGALGNLPPGLRERAINLHQDFMNASLAHRTRLFTLGKVAEKSYRKLEKANPDIGKKFYDIREGKLPPSALTDAEAEVYSQVTKLYDDMGKTLVDHGVLDPAQIRGGYMFHTYKNLEDLRKYHWNTNNPFSGDISEQFTKERAFQSYDDAVRESKNLNELARRSEAAGQTVRAYPVLEPEYDVFHNLARYIDMHSDSLARKAWQEELAETFGKGIDRVDVNALYDLARPILNEAGDEGKRIANFFGDAKTWRELEGQERTFFRQAGPETRTVSETVSSFSTQAGATTRAAGTGKPAVATRVTHKVLDTRPSKIRTDTGKIGEGEVRLAKNMRKFMGTLSNDGKREFLRQTLMRARSHSQIAAIERELYDDFSELFPKRLIQAFDSTPDAALTRTLGENAAEMIPVKAVWTGDEGMMLPRAIWEDLQTVNSKLLNSKDYKEFTGMLKYFDWANNKFKLGTYTFWPASAFRDAYSNIALSFLDIGMQAMNPAFAKHAVGILANRKGEFVTKSGIRYGYEQLRRMANDLGVYVDGEVFAELAGTAGRAGKFIRKPLKYRAMIENEARVHLWLANMRRGATPREAADHVGQFLFNYGEVSQVEREVFRRFIPFYTFTRKNVELQVKMLKKNPGLVINQVKPFRKRDSEGEMMVKWEREGLGIRLDKDGKTVHMIQGVDLPLRNLDTIWAGGLGPTGRRIMGMVSPLIKTPLEAITGRDFFTGGDLKRTTAPTLGRVLDSGHTPKALKDWMGFKKEIDAAGRPTYTFDGVRYAIVVKSWMFSRVMSTSDRQFREYADDSNVSGAMLDFLTGLRDKKIDLDEQQRRTLKRRIRELQQVRVRRGLAEEFTRPFVRKDQRGVSFQ